MPPPPPRRWPRRRATCPRRPPVPLAAVQRIGGSPRRWHPADRSACRRQPGRCWPVPGSLGKADDFLDDTHQRESTSTTRLAPSSAAPCWRAWSSIAVARAARSSGCYRMAQNLQQLGRAPLTWKPGLGDRRAGSARRVHALRSSLADVPRALEGLRPERAAARPDLEAPAGAEPLIVVLVRARPRPVVVGITSAPASFGGVSVGNDTERSPSRVDDRLPLVLAAGS